jgi:hypothetical protein
MWMWKTFETGWEALEPQTSLFVAMQTSLFVAMQTSLSEAERTS